MIKYPLYISGVLTVAGVTGEQTGLNSPPALVFTVGAEKVSGRFGGSQISLHVQRPFGNEDYRKYARETKQYHEHVF